MKKVTRFSIITLLVLSLVIVSFSTVFANHIEQPKRVWADPTVSTSDKGVTFDSIALDSWQLPGTVTANSGMTLPTGFPANQAQFGGKGIHVSGLPDGKYVEVCFSFPVYIYSWAGTIYKWSGTKWVAMPTTITPATGESNTTTACTLRAGNGVYSLIIGFWGTPEAPLT